MYSGLLTLATADDVHYAVIATAGSPGQLVQLTLNLQTGALIVVAGTPVDGYSTRHHFDTNKSSTFEPHGPRRGDHTGYDIFEVRSTC